jgi:hypothetical protein
MPYVVAFFAPPVALFLAHRPLAAIITLACYILVWMGTFAGLVVPGLILFLFPIFILWFAAFWFMPAAYTVAVIHAQSAGTAAPQWTDYAFALRRLSFTLVLITAFFGASYAIFWLYMAHRFREQLDTWAKTQDYAARWDSASFEGFPFTVGLRLTNTAFGETELVPYKLNAPLVTMQTLPWDLTLVDFTVQNLSAGGKLAALHIGNIDGQVTLPGFSKRHEDFLGLNVFARQLRLPEIPRPLSDTIDSAQIIAAVNGTIPSGPLREALPIWRDNHGSIDLPSIELHWGDFKLTIYGGILTLDQTLQPTGTFTAAVVNQTAAIDAVVAAGGLSAQDGDALKFALASSVQDMLIENNHLKIGQKEIVALPHIEWP